MSDQQDYAEQLEADVAKAAAPGKEKYSDAYYHRPSVVYFMAAGYPIKAIKIGVTARNTVKQRLRSIQGSNHERIALWKVLEFLDGERPGLQAELQERELHIRFKNYQRAEAFSVGAEWFDPSEELMEFIDQLPLLPEDLRDLSFHNLADRMADQAQFSREYIESMTED